MLPLLPAYQRFRTWHVKHQLALITAALIVLAISVVYWRIIRGYSPPVAYVAWPAPPEWVERLYTARWVVRLIQIVAGGTLFYLEWASAAFSVWLNHWLGHPIRRTILLLATAFVLGSYLLQPGRITVGDSLAHIATPWVLRETLHDGQWPAFWTNYGYFGHPFLQFYSPAYYYFVAAVSLVVKDFFTATDVTLLILHILSAVPMFLYVRNLTGSRIAGFVASLAWGGTFYRYHLIMAIGKLPVALFLALWPVQFYCIDVLAERGSRLLKHWVVLALTLGLMFWTHMLYGGWAVMAGVLYAAVRCFVPWPLMDGKKSAVRLGAIVGAHFAGTAMAAYYVIPAFLERNLVVGGPLIEGFSLPTIGLDSVLVFEGSYLTNWFGGFIGNTVVALSVLSLIAIPVLKYAKGAALAVQYVVISLMVFVPHYWPELFDVVFHLVPGGVLAYSGKSPGMYLILLIGPMTALVGLFVYLAGEGLKRVLQNRAAHSLLDEERSEGLTVLRVGILAGALLVFELIPLSMWVNLKYPDHYSGERLGRESLYAVLRESGDRTKRVIDVDGGFNNWFYTAMMTGQPGLIGHTPDAPLLVDAAANQVLGLLKRDIDIGALAPETNALLRQLNVGYLISDAPGHNFDGPIELAKTEQAVLWQVPESAPVVIVGSGEVVEVLDYQATSAAVEMQFSLMGRAFLQAAYTAYPHQRVLLDDVPIAPSTTDLGLIGFWAEPGVHKLRIQPELSPLRKWMLGISFFSVVATMGVGLFGSLQRAH